MLKTIEQQVFYYQIICGGLGALTVALLSLFCFVYCHYKRKFKQITTVPGIPTLIKRIDSIGGSIATLGIHQMNANELNEQTGKLNINNKAHLQIMLGHYTHLLQERVEVQMTKAQSALWHEKLAALDAKYNLQDFIFIAMDIPEDHVNYQLV